MTLALIDYTPFVCLGAAHWDVIAKANGDCARGDDVPGTYRRRIGGVATNLARNLHHAGQPTTLIASVGDDDAGRSLITDLGAQGLTTTGLIPLPDHPTDSYIAIEDPRGLVGAVAVDRAMRAGLDSMLNQLRITRGHLILDGNLIPLIADRPDWHHHLRERRASVVCASPVKSTRLSDLLMTALLPDLYCNLAEARAILGAPDISPPEAARNLLPMGVSLVVITDGARETTVAWAHSKGLSVKTRTPPAITPTRITGAGDFFTAQFIAARAGGADPLTALERAQTATATYLTGPAT